MKLALVTLFALAASIALPSPSQPQSQSQSQSYIDESEEDDNAEQLYKRANPNLDPLVAENGGFRLKRPGVTTCQDQRCCKFYPLAAALKSTFTDQTGGCTDDARAVLRMAFHDAGASGNINGAYVGGADGSLMKFGSDELNRDENRGLLTYVAKLEALAPIYNIGFADLIQFAGIVALMTCPGAPRVKFLAGRNEATAAAPRNMLPDPNDAAAVLFKSFANKGFSKAELVALIGAHSVADQSFVVPDSKSNSDTTAMIWDNLYYRELYLPTNPQGVFRFNSDLNLANDPTSKPIAQGFGASQALWGDTYALAHYRMSLLGVKVPKAQLYDCSEALPPLKGVPGGTVQSRFRSIGLDPNMML